MNQSRKILVIDDDPSVLAAVESYLADQDYDVVKASRWTEAIAQLEESQPDAVLLDLRLPTVQGEALLEFIREMHSELPVVIISTDITPSEMGRLSNLGASGFIRKPFETDDLMVVLEQVLLDLATVSAPAPSRPNREANPQTGQTAASTDTTAASGSGPASHLPPNVLPGSGVQDLARRLSPARMPAEPAEDYRRKRVRKKKHSRSGPKFKRIRNFALIIVFFFMIAGVLYLMQQGLNSGFLGGVSVSKTLQEEQAP